MGTSYSCRHACRRTRKAEVHVISNSFLSFSPGLSLRAGNFEVGGDLREDELMQGSGSPSQGMGRLGGRNQT